MFFGTWVRFPPPPPFFIPVSRDIGGFSVVPQDLNENHFEPVQGCTKVTWMDFGEVGDDLAFHYMASSMAKMMGSTFEKVDLPSNKSQKRQPFGLKSLPNQDVVLN
jgi:hypothetical protein